MMINTYGAALILAVVTGIKTRWLFSRLVVLVAMAFLLSVRLTWATVAAPPISPIDTMTLMPAPASMEWGPGMFIVGAAIPIDVRGGRQKRLMNALERWREELFLQTEKQLTLIESDNETVGLLRITVSTPGRDYPQLDTNESYELSITDGGISVTAPNTYGALHALQTLRQLASDCDGALCFPFVEISDQPRFAWRGLLIDVVRHWMPIDVIKRQLDGMAAVKLNVLHWHLSDDQGFRVESVVYPLLHLKGSDGNYYTQAQIREIVEYGADRGIRIMPEFDLPGHSRSWQIAYPMLASRPDEGYTLYATDSTFSDPIDPTREVVYTFIEALTTEMAALFPDRYFHLGGDEVNYSAWEENEGISNFMQAQGIGDYPDLQAYFVQRYAKIIQEQGKIAIGWNDILHENLSEDIVLHLWDRMNFPPLVDRHPLLVSTHYYLDQIRSAEFHYRNDPLAILIEGGGRKGDTFPLSNVLGVEAASWGEFIDPWNIDICIWPRTAAIAERFWSPAHYTDGADMEDVYRRMEKTSLRLHQMGMMHKRNQQTELAQLAAGGDIEALQTLADVVQPVRHYPLLSWRMLGQGFAPWIFGEIPNEPTPLQPFTRVLAYESLTAWHFNRKVERYLENPDDKELERALLAQLQLWSVLPERLRSTMKNSRGLQQAGVDSLAEAVAELADIGIALIEAGQQSRGLTRNELENYHDTVKRFERPPQVMTEEFLWYFVSRIMEPRAYMQHYIPIQEGVAELVNAMIQENK